jgi:TPR repeat protein
MYTNGQGVPQDYKAAVKWYRLAAEQGDASAQFNLGLMYKNGQGVPQNYIMAYMWFNLAAANGDKGAVKGRDIVAKLLTQADLGKAQEMSRACQAGNYKDCGT